MDIYCWNWNGGGTIAIIPLSKEKEEGIESSSSIIMSLEAMMKSQVENSEAQGALVYMPSKYHKFA